MNVEAEIRDLKRRVDELEGSFGFLMEQVKGVHRDLLGFQERTEARFDRIESKIDRVETDVRSLREDLPEIVSSAIREVIRPGSR